MITNAIETDTREGYSAYLMSDPCPEMPESDGNGHILTARQGLHRAAVRIENVDSGRSDEADRLADAIESAVSRWGFDWDKITRYLAAFYDVRAMDYTDWNGSEYTTLICLITGALARDAWGVLGTGSLNTTTARECLADYRAYRDGEVYGYVVTDPDGNDVGSCWGFYGCPDDAMSQAIDERDAAIAERHTARVDMYRALIG